MTPVMVLSDGYIANAAQPWSIPDVKTLPRFAVRFAEAGEGGFQPYARDPDTGARPWAPPGRQGLEHRIGGLEKGAAEGHISYDPKNHQRMVDARAAKVEGMAHDIPPQRPELGHDRGPLAVVGWGSTYGPISRAVMVLREQGYDVAHIHLRHLNPFPANLGELLAGYDRILVPEMNAGQLVTLLRARYLLPAEPLTKVTGLPFKIEEVQHAILERLEKIA
jgi:2-oxoglutarate ferredoxin oxidoreductase subunit alpha